MNPDTHGGIAARLLTGLALTAATAVAMAQTAAPPAATASADSGTETPGLQEIVVTATRREESISKVPISITALNQDTIDQKGIKDFQDIVRFTPRRGHRLQPDQRRSRSAASPRAAARAPPASTSTIRRSRCASWASIPTTRWPKTFDLDRVEVLRGPQGTLFGAGSEGGTVRYIMTQPSLTKASTYVRTEASYTEYGAAELRVRQSRTAAPSSTARSGFAPAPGTAATAAGSTASTRPTDADDRPTTSTTRDTLVLRLAGIWQPVSPFTVTPSMLYQNRRSTMSRPTGRPTPIPAPAQFNNADAGADAGIR